jgi:hypothetical protein
MPLALHMDEDQPRPKQPEQLELSTEPASAAEQRLERERDALLQSLSAGAGDTLVHRVAIVLNRFPETRDSDVKMMLRYWEVYEGYHGGSIEPADLFSRARLTSLTRARARIQNTYNLFQASPDIRKRRGKLSDEEYEKALEAAERYPGLTVLIDESGKTGANLIVAAVWFGDPQEFFVLTRMLGEWRLQTGFDNEMHFKELNENVEPYYRAALELLLNEAASVSFKAVSVSREGIRHVDDALEELTYQLLRRGAQHEHDTGRATFPRAMQVWKDQENKGADKLLLARLKDRIQQAGRIEIDGQLTADDFECVESHKSDPMQIADLFAGSLNRVINGAGRDRPKDRFARYFLERVGMPGGPAAEAAFDVDMVMHIKM